MRVRLGFVSNSSSTSFTITNRSKEIKTLADFVIENGYLLDKFLDRYDWHKSETRYSQDSMIAGAIELNVVFQPRGKPLPYVWR